ncbi:hypothetical protein [Hymenobacter psychrophilus]|uniref:Replication initiation factor n=1 Tax=Hymenobacter psychrophilus TaxID=651662 RepID=A0A1H3IGI4_9BACT|nr:hypothetical protein [Hymenobacter psychrophilus]SDY26983.1 hypothetical protein SAMN04488069_10716 [Hymenobacter psychrophilus]
MDALTLSLENDAQTPTLTAAFIKSQYLLIGKNYRLADDLTLQPISLSRQPGSGTFRYGFTVYADEQEIGTLRTDPKGVCAEEAGLISFTFANWLFYTRTGWYHYYLLLRDTLGLQLRCISYCEIALDFNVELLKLVDGVFHDSSLAKRRDEAPRYRAVLPQLTAKTSGYGGYEFGKPARGPRGNGKQVVGYDKTQEIEKNGKHYITEWHRLNGLNTACTVERWEVRLANHWLRLFNVMPEDLSSPEKLVTIYAHAMRDVLSFRDLEQPQRDKHRNLQYATVCLLNVDDLTPQDLQKVVRGVQQDQRKLKKRGALREAVHTWIETGSETTAAYVREFIQQPPPKGTTWPHLIEAYALDYKGYPYTGVAQRTKAVSHLYVPMGGECGRVGTSVVNKIGLPYAQ